MSKSPGTLARRAYTGEAARAIFDARIRRDPSIVADELGLDTVTSRQVSRAANDLTRRTQESLRRRGISGKVTVYRVGELSKNHDSFSLKPWRTGGGRSKAVPYQVDAKDIVFDTDAILPHGTFVESEVFIRPGSAKPLRKSSSGGAWDESLHPRDPQSGEWVNK